MASQSIPKRARPWYRRRKATRAHKLLVPFTWGECGLGAYGVTSWAHTVLEVVHSGDDSDWYRGKYLEHGKQIRIAPGTLYIEVMSVGTPRTQRQTARLVIVGNRGEHHQVGNNYNWRTQNRQFRELVESMMNALAPRGVHRVKRRDPSRELDYQAELAKHSKHKLKCEQVSMFQKRYFPMRCLDK